MHPCIESISCLHVLRSCRCWIPQVTVCTGPQNTPAQNTSARAGSPQPASMAAARPQPGRGPVQPQPAPRPAFPPSSHGSSARAPAVPVRHPFTLLRIHCVFQCPAGSCFAAGHFTTTAEQRQHQCVVNMHIGVVVVFECEL